MAKAIAKRLQSAAGGTIGTRYSCKIWSGGTDYSAVDSPGDRFRGGTVHSVTSLPRKFNMEKTWRSMEETGAFVAATFIMKSGRQLLEQLHHDGRRTCQFRPELSDYTARMAYVSD